MRQVGGLPPAHRDASRHAGKRRAAAHDVYPAAQDLDSAARRRERPIVQAIDAAAELVLRRDDEFRGRRGCRRAEVGDEIGDRDVGLVSHRRDHRYRHACDRARHHFLVERPQIFDRSAAATDDDDIHALDAADLT